MQPKDAHRFEGNNAWYVDDKGQVIVIPDHNGRFAFPLDEMEKALKSAKPIRKEYLEYQAALEKARAEPAADESEG